MRKSDAAVRKWPLRSDLVVVGVLAAAELCHHVGRNVILGPRSLEFVQVIEDRQAGLDPVLLLRRHDLGAIERTDRNGDMFRVIIGESKRRTAFAAEAALYHLG